MKKKIGAVLLIVMLLTITVPVMGTTCTLHQQVSVSPDSKVQTTEVVITLHSLKGRENVHLQIAVDDLEALGDQPDVEDILALLPEEKRGEIQQRLENDKTNLLELGKRTSLFSSQSLWGRMRNVLPLNDSWVNYLCTVKGVGLIFLFPPFLPITPLLYAGLVVVNSNGTNGEINRAMEHAIMAPFIGVSVWWLQAYVFAGLAGVVYCWNND